MDDRLKILLITDEVWNDAVHPKNVLSNWFEGFNAEFAQIYCSSGIPGNKCCWKYFQLTDRMMLKSIFGGEKAGRTFETFNGIRGSDGDVPENEENKKIVSLMKSIVSEPARAVRDWIWLTGRYDEGKLKQFISEFKPDVVFCPRYATRKMLRLERKIYELSGKPMVAFTGDDEYSLKQLRFSLVYWIRRFLVRKDIRKTMPVYSKYYTLSSEQLQEYKNNFNIDAGILKKCADFNGVQIKKSVNSPIKIIYAGKLYCQRWRTLVEINRALKKINKDGTKMTLDIYTKDRITARQKKMLDDNKNSFLMGAVPEEELRKVYQNADIALHVEALDLQNRLTTRLSFSTKIIDCLASGCAVMVISWARHSGYAYLKKEDAAICIDNYEKIGTVLGSIIKNPEILLEYAKKAWECGKRNHQIDIIQKNLYKDLTNLAGKNKNENITD
ncbi:MAG: glycosyltransferase family 1 protein [Candidatus Margulisbacteria bacterium]|nr:glycosyltransferase family 1 protein [Candidatus Margulisiibacteriota bacterium]